MQQIVSITRCIYIPKFDEKTDEYIDVSPYKKYERNPTSKISIGMYASKNSLPAINSINNSPKK